MRTLAAAQRTGDRYGYDHTDGHHHDGGEVEVDEEELEDMEALNQSLSQDLQYHGGRAHDYGDKDHKQGSDEMGMLQKSVFNLLSQESEKLIKDLYLKYRHKLRDEYRHRC